MSRDWKAAFRYARSLFLLAKEKGSLAEREQEMRGILDFARNHPEFSRLLLTSTLAYSEKEALIENLLGFASEEMRSFLKLLVRKNRYPLFERMVEDFHRLFNEAQGIEEALAVSPYPLGQETEDQIKRMLEKKWKKKVRLETKIDPSLLGGVAVYTRKLVIDGTVKERLKSLRQGLLRRF